MSICLAAVAATSWTTRVGADTSPTDDQVRQILRQRIDVDKRGVGIVVGLIDEKGTRMVGYGRTVKGDGTEVDGHTIFEIGSVTKTFTTLLLADMIAKGEVKLEDPVAKYLPPEVKVPARGGRPITFLDLATHRSGLPVMPDNHRPADKENPFADYTVAQLYAFLSGYELTRDIGGKFEYSNLGVGLLGHALALRAGKPYEDLVVERICLPLGMTDTRITLSKSMRDRLAAPYDESLTPAKNWDLPAIAGAGALRSDVDDMLKFVAANLGLTKTPLTDAMRETQKVRNTTESPVLDIGLAWHVLKRYDPPIWWHNGGTAGYRSFVGFCPAKKTGVVMLSNSGVGVDDIGFHLLDERHELVAPPRKRTAVPIKPEIADQYLGRYEIIPEFVLTFTREGDRYFLAATGQEKDEVFPETAADFFSKSFDGQVTFVKDAQGKYSTLVLHQGGFPDQAGRRLP